MAKTTKQKKPFYKKWWFWVVAVLVILMGIGGAGKDAPERSMPEAVEATEAPTATPKPTPRPTAKPTEVPDPTDTPEPTPEPTPTPEPVHDYVLNTNTMKFHKPSCSSVDEMNAGNRKDYTGTRDSVLDMGYEPCGRCNP